MSDPKRVRITGTVVYEFEDDKELWGDGGIENATDEMLISEAVEALESASPWQIEWRVTR